MRVYLLIRFLLTSVHLWQLGFSSLGQTRRVNVADLWDPTLSQLSFIKLIEIAQDFALAEMDGKDNTKLNLTKFAVTYIDEDGDRINISSNEELMDSFLQTVKKQPFRPFRITVTTTDASTKSFGKARCAEPSTAPVAIDCDTKINGNTGVVAPTSRLFGSAPSARVVQCAMANKDSKGTIAGEAASDVFIHARHTW